jgi:hypothetical protein
MTLCVEAASVPMVLYEQMLQTMGPKSLLKMTLSLSSDTFVVLHAWLFPLQGKSSGRLNADSSSHAHSLHSHSHSYRQGRMYGLQRDKTARNEFYLSLDTLSIRSTNDILLFHTCFHIKDLVYIFCELVT